MKKKIVQFIPSYVLHDVNKNIPFKRKATMTKSPSTLTRIVSKNITAYIINIRLLVHIPHKTYIDTHLGYDILTFYY